MADENAERNGDLVTVVIVNYETSAYVKRCVESLRRQNQAWEAVVVDNPSAEKDYRNLSSEPPVRVVRSPENVGYGLGCNLGASQASPQSEFICILNPDTAVPDGELARWVAAYRRHCPRGGILGPALHNENGAVQRSSYDFYNPLNYWVTHSLLAGFLINLKKGSWTGGKGRGFKEARQVDGAMLKNHTDARGHAGGQPTGNRHQRVGWLMGAALLIDRQTWQRLLGFSDKYFLYSEDTDLCWRCKALGLPVVYDPDIHIFHSQGDPAAGAAREMGIVRLFDGTKRFVDLNYSGAKQAGMYFVVCLDMIIRLAIMLPMRLMKKDDLLLESRIRGYTRVLQQWLGMSS